MAFLRSRFALALATCGLLVASAWSADDDGFRPLFNGKDLAGWEGDPALPPDLESRTADEWLADRGQSEAARALVWSPLSRFLLGDDLTVVSAAMLITTLTRCFLSARRNSGIAIPALGMRHLLLEPARARIYRDVDHRDVLFPHSRRRHDLA